MRSYRPLVVLDIDGVLADFCTAFTQLAVNQGLIPEAFGGDEAKVWAFDFPVDPVWEEVSKSRVFWERLDPLIDEEDLSAIHAAATECNIAYITSRKETGNVAEQTKRWLMNCDLPEGTLFLPNTRDKSGIVLAAKHQMAGMLDDNPDTLIALANEGVPIVARVWPYNAGIAVPHVNSVAQFVDRLGIQATMVVGYKMPGWDFGGEDDGQLSD